MKRDYIKKIFKILALVDDTWILNEVYQFAVNMTRQQEILHPVIRNREATSGKQGFAAVSRISGEERMDE